MVVVCTLQTICAMTYFNTLSELPALPKKIGSKIA